ncbi:MAG: hypothetical protein COA66_00755 [Arcobacter sp.]|nr:MAG: hypothetical protein COA66_00755 [Arcobacter sp.]
MKIKLLQTIFLFISISTVHANQTFLMEQKELEKMIKSNTIYIIGLKEKSTWNKNTVNVKNFQRISQGVLEFKVSKIDFNTYKKDSIFLLSSKKRITSLAFLEKLKALGFNKVRYLKDGNKTLKDILLNFRGIKIFSIFNK